MAIKYEKLSHSYSINTPFQYAALNEVDLEIKEGSFSAIVGHTGSGKSTLIQHLNGLLLPTSGKVMVLDRVIEANKENKNLKQLRKRVGLVFQFPEYQLFEETILKDLCFGPMNFGLSEDEAKEKAIKALKLVGLDQDYLERSPFDLSGGQKRRVAIAGVLAMDPDIIVLDEPTAGLDPQGARQMMDLFKHLNKVEGKTIILVSHDMDHVLNYCDQVILMNGGRVVNVSSVKDFFSDTKKLIELNIAPPLICETIATLNDKGFGLDSKCYDLSILAKNIIKEIKK